MFDCVTYFDIGKFQIMPGVYDLRFKYKLPEELPTSMGLSDRCVRYRVIVGFCNRFWFDSEYKREIFIIRNLDLNCDPEYRVSYVHWLQNYIVLATVRFYSTQSCQNGVPASCHTLN